MINYKDRVLNLKGDIMKFNKLSLVIILSGFALYTQQTRSDNAEMLSYVKSNFPWITVSSYNPSPVKFHDEKLGKNVTVGSVSKMETEYDAKGIPKLKRDELYEKRIVGTPGLWNLLMFPTKVTMKEDEFVICGKKSGQAPRCFGRLSTGEVPADVMTVSDRERSFKPMEVRGEEARSYAKLKALEKQISEHFLER